LSSGRRAVSPRCLLLMGLTLPIMGQGAGIAAAITIKIAAKSGGIDAC
jgi:hypothetical protein